MNRHKNQKTENQSGQTDVEQRWKKFLKLGMEDDYSTLNGVACYYQVAFVLTEGLEPVLL